MFLFLQVLCVSILLIGLIVFFRLKKRAAKRTIAMLCVLLVISAIVANMVLSWIPTATEQITLTATGEKNEDAATNEVALIGVTVDGKTDTVFNINEGKWFWQDNRYMWRNENDTRQPEGTTRSITIDIPVGSARELTLQKSPWSGIVDIIFDGEIKPYDLYSEATVNFQIPLPSTDFFYHTMVQAGRLALFVLFVILLIAYPFFAVIRFNDKIIWKWFRRNWDKITYILLAVCCFRVMFIIGKNSSFWQDEIWTLGWVYSGSPSKSLNIFQRLYDMWFFLAPYGQEYLLIISELLVAASVYVSGVTGALYNGKRFGVIMAAVCATSFPAMNQCGSEFRPYALLFFCVSLLLYFFIKKQREQWKRKSTIRLYGIVLTLTIDSHYFGLVLAGLMMVFDFGLAIFKKVKKAEMIELILPALYALYWLYATFFTRFSALNAYTWPSTPSLRGVGTILKWLCSGSYLLYSLLLIGAVIISAYLIGRIRRNSFDMYEDYILFVFLATPILIFALTFLYSFIFSKASVFVDRYFISILPNCLFIISIAIDTVIEVLSRNFREPVFREIADVGQIVCTISCILILCVIKWYTVPASFYSHQNYKASAKFLMSQNDIYNSSTICLVSGNVYVNDGFEYYLTEKGKRDPINHIAYQYFTDDLTKYETIYCVYHHNPCDLTSFLENGYEESYSNDALALKKFVKSNS